MGSGRGLEIILGSTYVVEHFSFCMFSSILIFDFYLISGSFFTFLGPNGPFLGLRQVSTTDLGSTHVVEQLSFSLFLSILIFGFDLILGSFLTLWGPNGLFLGVGECFENCFGVYLCSGTTFIFYICFNSDI